MEPPRVLQVVAHEDDDLGLMSPDLLGYVHSGAPLRTVYVTSGDAGFTCNDYTHDRELGVRASYAMMAGLPDQWDEVEQEVLGKLVRVVTLKGTQISLMFLGLHNGGYTDLVTPDLEALWGNQVQTISTRPYDGRSRIDTYTRSELVDVLLQIVKDFRATRINTLDSSRLQPMVWPFDHSDHVHSALFSLAGLLNYDAPHTVGMYRAYNSQFELSNVSSEDAAIKLKVFNLYLSHDPKVCPIGNTMVCGQTVPCDLSELYVGYEQRQYRTAVYQNITSLMRGPGSQCLQGSPFRGPGSRGDGGTPPGTMSPLAADAGVDASVGNPSGGTVQLVSCDPSDRRQRWRVTADNTVLHLASGMCLDAAAGQRGSVLQIAPCNASATQRFMLTTQSQLRGPDSTCVQSDANLTLQECTLDPRQLNWTPGIYSTVVDQLIDGLNDVDIPDSVTYYGSFSFGDVNGDGSGDLCVRRVDGLYCAFGLLELLTDYSLVLSNLSDENGWLPPEYGSTVQLGDIDGDGAAEVCGRAYDGVYCATFSVLFGNFGEFSKRSSGNDFSDLAGYASSASRYRSLRLADVNNDNRADVCARNAMGIECALATTDGHFNAAQQWTSEEFSDANGWNVDAAGGTLRYGDITGDGHADVCGRSTQGVVCASNDGAGHFVEPHLWSHTGDFDDKSGWNAQASYYGSIRLLDIDADGSADVCGRSPNGLVCGISIGTAFSYVTSLASSDAYSDSKGWKSDRYGSTIGLMDLNLDGMPDLCGWGPGADGVGLRCALSDAASQ